MTKSKKKATTLTPIEAAQRFWDTRPNYVLSYSPMKDMYAIVDTFDNSATMYTPKELIASYNDLKDLKHDA